MTIVLSMKNYLYGNPAHEAIRREPDPAVRLAVVWEVAAKVEGIRKALADAAAFAARFDALGQDPDFDPDAPRDLRKAIADAEAFRRRLASHPDGAALRTAIDRGNRINFSDSDAEAFMNQTGGVSLRAAVDCADLIAFRDAAATVATLGAKVCDAIEAVGWNASQLAEALAVLEIAWRHQVTQEAAGT